MHLIFKEKPPIIYILIGAAVFILSIVNFYYSNMLLHMLTRAFGLLLLASSFFLDAFQIYYESKTKNKSIKHISQGLIFIGVAFIATSIYLDT